MDDSDGDWKDWLSFVLLIPFLPLVIALGVLSALIEAAFEAPFMMACFILALGWAVGWWI